MLNQLLLKGKVVEKGDTWIVLEVNEETLLAVDNVDTSEVLINNVVAIKGHLRTGSHCENIKIYCDNLIVLDGRGKK